MDVFDIRLHGFEDAPGRDPSADLARAFGIDVDQARRIVARAPVVVKKGIAEDVAERFFHALRGIGAKVTIEKRSVASIAPQGMEVAPTRAPPGSRPPGATEPNPSLPPPPGMGLPLPDVSDDPFDRGGFGGGGFESTSATTAGAGGYGAFDGRSIDVGEIGPTIDLDVDPKVLASVRPPPRGSSAYPPATHGPSSNAPPPAAVGIVPGAATHTRSGFPPPAASKVRGPFLPALLSAFAYPLQRQAVPVILGIAIVSQLLGYIWIIGWLLSLAVVATYLFAIVRATHNDKDELPTAGDFTDLSDLIGPAIRYLLALVVPFAPAVALAFILPPTGSFYLVGIVLASIAGVLYMPASFMVAALGTGCLAPLNPIAGVMIITRVPGPYALVTLAVGFVIAIDAVVGIAWKALGPVTATIPFVPGLIAAAIGLVFSFIAARMLGLFLRHYENELGLD